MKMKIIFIIAFDICCANGFNIDIKILLNRRALFGYKLDINLYEQSRLKEAWFSIGTDFSDLEILNLNTQWQEIKDFEGSH